MGPGRRSEARYRALLEHLPDMAVMTFDGDMRYDLAAGAPTEPPRDLCLGAAPLYQDGGRVQLQHQHLADQRTLELLRSVGVDYAQGFQVGGPVPIAQAGLVLPERAVTG